MAFSIAIAGKGGTGKTTFSGLLIKCLIDRHLEPILAIDADPNVNLNYVLGVEVIDTVGGIREDVLIKRGDLPAGMSKPDYINYKIHSSIVESDGYDLIVMGRKGLSALERLFIGSVANQVLRNSPIPILLTKKKSGKPI